MKFRVFGAALAAALIVVPCSNADGSSARYELAHGCYALQAAATAKFVAKRGDGYAATADSAAAAEPFRMQATDLGRYLFFGRAADFMAAEELGRVVVADAPSGRADWVVDGRRKAFTITLPAAGRALAVGDGGTLVLAGAPTRFDFVPTGGCAEFPEAEINVTGEPLRGESGWDEVRGFVDPHFHWMAFEFLGGSFHCGRPWHRFGIAAALVDCPDHEPNGAGAAAENVLSYGTPARTHDTDGWPTFAGWPKFDSLTHEGSYHRWVERAWRAGLRLTTVLFVENAILCQAYPLKRNSCDEMDSIRLQAKRFRELVDYIDAQNGGPGKGWLRVVRDPFEAREVINDGKLAVVLGIETSRLFGCQELDGEPTCTSASIDEQLDEMHRLGVRQMEIVNKFDNALTGVAGDGGSTGAVVNNGNKLETNHFWRMRTCEPELDRIHAHDKPQPVNSTQARSAGAFDGVFTSDALSGQTPIYPPLPHCNVAGLTDLGVHLIEGMMDKGMIFDPDHMSARARIHALDLLEKRQYSGVISSHSWSTVDSYPRILALGGMITPITGATHGFIEEWELIKPQAAPRFYFGLGFGSDMNGLHKQPPPRNPQDDKVTYPFKSFDGGSTIERTRAGTRTWDVNTDGTAHYGLLPDWIEDLRRVAGQGIIDDLARGAEAYLQMWERAVGVDGERCAPRRARIGEDGLAGVRLGSQPAALLRRAGQPERRDGEDLRFCVAGRQDSDVVAVFGRRDRVRIVASTAGGHRAGRVTPGDAASTLGGYARRLAPGLFVRPAGARRTFLYGVRSGRVRFVAVAPRRLAEDGRRLGGALRAAGLP